MVCRPRQLQSGTLLNQKISCKSGRYHDLAALTSFDGYYRADRVLPSCSLRRSYVIHAILAGLAFPICILLGMRDGTSFSHGLIDFIVLSGNSSKLWLFPIDCWRRLCDCVLHRVPVLIKALI